MKICSMKYSHTSMNLGDTIQTIAVEQFLPRVDMRLERDELNRVPLDDKYYVVMNGYFTAAPANWPPSNSVVPIFFGFHIADYKDVHMAVLSQSSINYFQRHQPIGCRDKGTASLLQERGVYTYYSKCLTLTFPRRNSNPKNGKIYIVDADEVTVPMQIATEAIRLSHDIPYWFSDEQKRSIAKERLDIYSKSANLVITTKLHCALPCIAMGIPVIFFGNADEYRVLLLRDLGVPIYKLPGRTIRRGYSILRRFLDSSKTGSVKLQLMSFILKAYHLIFYKRFFKKTLIDWNPQAVDIEDEKAEIIRRIIEQIDLALGSEDKTLL
jgi:hypothetical protein